MSAFKAIQRHQAGIMNQEPRKHLPDHRPEILYIGCVDARLDPIRDLGIPKGAALIFRNVGAVVFPDKSDRLSDLTAGDEVMVGEDGEIPASVSLGATIELFLGRLLPPKNITMKHIVVAGHTQCGGLGACWGGFKPEERNLQAYFRSSGLVRLCEEVKAQSAIDENFPLHGWEQEAIRASVRNLEAYDMVRKAIEQKRVRVHGWLIDTKTSRVDFMDPETGAFRPMASPRDFPSGGEWTP